MTIAESDRVFLDALARIELFQGFWREPERFLPNLNKLLEQLGLSQEVVVEEPPVRARDVAIHRWSALRRALYAHYGVLQETFVENARSVYTAMSAAGGTVASVGDQLSAELDVRVHADLYAALGGFDVAEINEGLGVWRSPSATWFRLGGAIAFPRRYPLYEPLPKRLLWLRQESFDVDAIGDVLLEAGAEALSRFFGAVASGGADLLSQKGRLSRDGEREKELALAVAVVEQRSRLFAERPSEDGRYLREEPPSTQEIIEALASSSTRDTKTVDA